ncbi:MAG: DinB family protein [Pirellulales bacterium]
MTQWIHYETPDTRGQIVTAFGALHAQTVVLWQRFSDDEFFKRPADGGWSPAQNVEHLIKATSPVTRALTMPRFVLRLLFGRARVPSRTFFEVRAAYRDVLAEGAQAGSYGPRSSASIDDAGRTRQRLLHRWQLVLPQLTEAIGRWDEASLDYYRLPHPLLGKLTVREMLYFSLYHVGHHAEIVAARQADSAPGDA